MSTRTAQAFDELYENVKEDSVISSKVAVRRDAVVRTLLAAFPASSSMVYQSSFVIGSLGRHTASRPFDDIDILAHISVDPDLWSRSYQRNSAEFLYRVRSSLVNSSTVKKIGARGQAVRLFYSDGLSVDVAAVVKYTSGGYGIPDGSGGWLGTDPKRHETYINERNAALGHNLKRFVVIVKQWNNAHSSRLSSFHLEMMAARTFRSLGTNRREALRSFFAYNVHNLSVTDPAGYGGDLSSYLSWQTQQTVNQSLIAARDRADLALAAEGRGDHAEAIRHWQIVLGSRFPSYG